MHIVVMSDIHINKYEPFASIDPLTGLNTRLLDGIGALRQVKDYCLAHKIKHILNGGDLFEKGATIASDVLELVVKELRDLQLNDIQFISIAGQHDFLTRDGLYNAPKALSALMDFMNEPGEYIDLGKEARIIGCSYRYGLQEQQTALEDCKKQIKKGGKNILLGHFLLREILKQNAAPFDDSDYVGLEDLPKAQLVLLGDYHFHVPLKKHNIISIGALMQHKFGITPNRPQGGFLDYDLDNMTFKRIEVDAPMFVSILPGEKITKELYDPKNFYEVTVEDQQEEDRIRAYLGDGWNVRFKKAEEQVETDQENRMDVTIEMEPSDVVKQYAEYFGMGQDYIQKGLGYL